MYMYMYICMVLFRLCIAACWRNGSGWMTIAQLVLESHKCGMTKPHHIISWPPSPWTGHKVGWSCTFILFIPRSDSTIQMWQQNETLSPRELQLTDSFLFFWGFSINPKGHLGGSRSTVSEIVTPARLASTTMLCSMSSADCLDGWLNALSCCHVISLLDIC